MFKCVLTHVDSTGVVISNIELTNEARNLPDKIAESLQDARYERSEQYNGIIRSIGVKLTFVGTGAGFIKSVFDIYGAGAIVNISIYYSVNGIDYNDVFTGKVDLKSYSYNYKNTTVECQLINGDIEDRLINGIEQKQAFTPDAGIWTSTLFRKRNRIVTADYVGGASSAIALGGVTTPNPTAIVPQMIKSSGSPRALNVVDWFYQENADNEHLNILMGAYYHYQARANSNYSITINTQYIVTGGDGVTGEPQYGLFALVNDRYGNVKSSNQIAPALGNFAMGVNTKTHTKTLSLEDGDVVILAYYLIAFIQSQYVTVKFNYFNVDLLAKEYQNDSAHPTIKAFTLLNLLAERLTGIENLIQSFLLNDYTASDRYKYTMFTSGKCIRTPFATFSGSEPVLSVSLADVIQALRVPFAIGMGIEGSGKIKRVVIDSIYQFYKPEVVVDLGEVVELTEEFEMTQVYNGISVNYPDNSSEDEADTFEFVGKTEYVTPLNYVKNQLTLKTDAIADGNTIELTRQLPITDTSTEADQNDEKLFLINCFNNGGVITTARGESITAFDSTSVPDDTFLYNIELWQPMALRHWAAWLLSGFKYQLGTVYELTNVATAANKTFNIALNISGTAVTLGSDDLIKIAKLRQMAKAVPIANGKDAIFEPILYNFKAYFTAEQLKMYENNRHGTIKFSYLGQIYYGYAMKVPAIPYVETDFTLLKLSNYAKSLL